MCGQVDIKDTNPTDASDAEELGNSPFRKV
jgi:hypothetical protein